MTNTTIKEVRGHTKKVIREVQTQTQIEINILLLPKSEMKNSNTNSKPLPFITINITKLIPSNVFIIKLIPSIYEEK
jgi:hypothetical protein